MKLTPEEQRKVCDLIRKGIPLPDKYRFLLFADPPRASLIWSGQTGEVCREAPPLFCREVFVPPARQRRSQTDAAQRAASSAHNGPEYAHHAAPQARWRNMLIRGDNRRVLSSLLHGPLRQAIAEQGGIKLIYIDPPFDAGCSFFADIPVGDRGSKTAARRPAGSALDAAASAHAQSSGRGAKSRIRRMAYADVWGSGADSFLAMMHERLLLMHDLLADDGTLYLHCDWRTAAPMRLLLDAVFGPGRFLGEIIWHYTGGGRAKRYFSRKHDTLLHYAKSSAWTFNIDAVRVPYKESSGYARGGITSAAGKHYAPDPRGTPVDDVWDIPIVNPLSHERLPYPTQKPEALLRRIMEASSNKGDLVADFFCGSGTTLAVAEKLGRDWIGADIGGMAVHTARKRLLRLQRESAVADEPARPFGLYVLPDSKETAWAANGMPAEASPLPGAASGSALADITIHTSLTGFSVELAGFVPEPGTLSTPEAAQCGQPAASWRDWVDYWSVDPDFGAWRAKEKPGRRNPAAGKANTQPPLETKDESSADHAAAAALTPAFRSRWQAFRTPAEPALTLRSPEFSLPPGTYTVAVQVMDILGNESVHLVEALVEAP